MLKKWDELTGRAGRTLPGHHPHLRKGERSDRRS